MDDPSKLESDLWEAADNLRANSKLTSSDYFMPVLGIIFLRHAANRFDAASQQIEEDQAAGKCRNGKFSQPITSAVARCWLPESGPLRLHHGAGVDRPRRPAEARHRCDERHRGGLRAA